MFLPGESHGQRSLANHSPWGHKVRHNCATNFHFHRYNAFFILTKHLPYTVAVTLATVKLTHISFFFFTISQTDDAVLLSILALSYDTLPFFIKSRVFTLSLKRSILWLLYGMSKSPHHSWIWGPFSKISVTWTQAPQYCSSWFDNRVGCCCYCCLAA